MRALSTTSACLCYVVCGGAAVLAAWCTSCRASRQYHPPGASFNPSQVRRNHSCNTREAAEKLQLTRNSTTRDTNEEAELMTKASAGVGR